MLARAQVYPAVAGLHTLFTNSLLRLLDIGDRIDVNAYLYCHVASIQFREGKGGRPPYSSFVPLNLDC